ncbi:hypothetical protein KJ784_02850 [Patescibacteria group bacterium]|nr:hypothetical protein [Patescibacteria group bacterium]MBU2265096.1 hypothetical protein [Patescibacteria group bacterium]
MKYSKLSDYRIKKILKCSCFELITIQTAKELRLNRHAIDRYFRDFEHNRTTKI